MTDASGTRASLRLVTDGRWGLRRAIAVALTTAGLAAFCPSAPVFAQQYRTNPVNDRARIEHRAAVLAAVRTPATYAATKERFEEYFNNYHFPAMTRYGPDDLKELGGLREQLFTRFLWGATTNEQLQRDLTELALPQFASMVYSREQPQYHPAVRYNAILSLGLLDEQYAIDSAANARPPRPHPRANDFLTQVVDRATTSDQFPAAVVLGALVGLERHARYHQSLPPERVAAMTDALLKIVNQERPILGLTRANFAWLQLRAASALAELGTVGPENKTHDALVRLIGELRILDDRCAAAALLAKINYEGATVDGAAAVETLLALARDVAEAEETRAKEFEDMHVGGGGRPGGGVRGGGAARVGPMGGFGQAAPYERRPMLARITDLRSGLQAVKPIAPAEAQAAIDEIVGAIGPVVTAGTNKDTLELTLASQVREMSREISRAARPGQAPVADDPAELFEG